MLSNTEKMDKEMEELFAQIEEEQRKEDEQAKGDGFTHKTTLWIHPVDGGDDTAEIFYTEGEPSQNTIQRKLRFSEVKNDYMVEAL